MTNNNIKYAQLTLGNKDIVSLTYTETGQEIIAHNGVTVSCSELGPLIGFRESLNTLSWLKRKIDG